MSVAFDHDVLVVGLGPVGAATAALLADEGLSVLAVDKDSLVYPLPRAAHFDHEIMRLFQRLGLVEAIAPHIRMAPAYEFRNGAGEILMRFEAGTRSPSGWAPSYMMHQPAIEHALRARLARSANVEVRLDQAFESLTQDADGVTATLRGADGVARTARARALVACDGAHSPVREALGIGLDDLKFDEPWLVIDVRVLDEGRLPNVNLQVCDPARPTTSVLMGPGRHRWEFMLRPGETAEQVLDDDFILELLEPWDCADRVELERKAVYRFHGLVARTWRDGRVLLAGDAAHQTPPFAGQGLCSGLRDAANLAWKLGAVLRGEASASVLDSYQIEREPAARAVIELAIAMGRVVCATDPQVAAERDARMMAQAASGVRPMPPAAGGAIAAGLILAGSPGAGELFPQAWAEPGLKLDDVLGPGAWLISRRGVPEARGGSVATIGLALDDLRISPFRAEIERWLSARGAEAVLVRADRHVFGTGEASFLVEAFRMAMGPRSQPAALAAS